VPGWPHGTWTPVHSRSRPRARLWESRCRIVVVDRPAESLGWRHQSIGFFPLPFVGLARNVRRAVLNFGHVALCGLRSLASTGPAAGRAPHASNGSDQHGFASCWRQRPKLGERFDRPARRSCYRCIIRHRLCGRVVARRSRLPHVRHKSVAAKRNWTQRCRDGATRRAL
jgi:hypothetical protein